MHVHLLLTSHLLNLNTAIVNIRLHPDPVLSIVRQFECMSRTRGAAMVFHFELASYFVTKGGLGTAATLPIRRIVY